MRRALVGLLAVAGVWSAEAYAQTAEVAPLQGYAIASWSSGEGRGLGPVRALAQDADGYLWLAAESGLLRFDGFQFADARTIVSPDLPAVPARTVYAGTHGDLWVGFAEGGGIYRLRQKQIAGGPVDGVNGAVNAFVQDAAGTLWAGHDAGLLRWTGERWESVGDDTGFTAARVFHLRTSGNLLVAGTDAGLFTTAIDALRFTRFREAGTQLIRGSAEDGRGTVWITHPTRGVQNIRGERLPTPARGSSLLRDSRGNIWLATIGQGLWRFPEAGGAARVERAGVTGGMLTDGVWSMLEDREGNLWVGTHEGLNRLTPQTVTPITGLGVLSGIARDMNGTTWVAGFEAMVALRERGAGIERRFLPLQGARTVVVDRDGVAWTATADGLFRLTERGSTAVSAPAGVELRQITALAADQDRGIWIADAVQGLWRLASGRLEPRPLPPPYGGERVSALHHAAGNQLWIGFERGMAAALSPDGRFVAYGAAEGLPHERINGILEAPHTGLWMHGSHGLSHFIDGRFVTLGRERGLPSRRVASAADDAAGGLWVGLGDVGVAHLTRDELVRALADPLYRLHPQVFDTSDGLAGMPLSLDSRSALRDERGRIWFVTGRGVSIVEPDVAKARPHASGAARVEGAIAGDQRFDPADGAALPAGTNRLRIDYTAINLTSPEHTRFRYRLEGFDETWRDAGQRRQAFYTNLAPQAYTFRVQADPGDGSWRDSSAAWTFSIAPRFYQTWTFYALCAVGALASIGCAWRLRLRRVHKEFAAVLAERARLSRELHDTLLQTMVGVSLHLDNVAAGSPPADPATREQLVSLRHEIEHCILDARQTIADMRAGSSERGDLISSLERVGARATAQTDVRFRLRVSGTPFQVPPRIDAELMRIAQEAVTNAVRHASPSELTMELQYTPGAISLRVVDDGTGFEEASHPAAGHFGLVTMRERAQQVGGRLRLTSAAGAGTQIEAVIPV